MVASLPNGKRGQRGTQTSLGLLGDNKGGGVGCCPAPLLIGPPSAVLSKGAPLFIPKRPEEPPTCLLGCGYQTSPSPGKRGLTLHNPLASSRRSLGCQDQLHTQPTTQLAKSAPSWQQREAGCSLSPTEGPREAGSAASPPLRIRLGLQKDPPPFVLSPGGRSWPVLPAREASSRSPGCPS